MIIPLVNIPMMIILKYANLWYTKKVRPWQFPLRLDHTSLSSSELGILVITTSRGDKKPMMVNVREIILKWPNYSVPDLQTTVVKTTSGRLQNLLDVVAP